jgi:DNA-binding response OmpR family regulator
MPRILIVEDNADLAFGLRINLEQAAHVVAAVDNGTAALEHVRSSGYDLMILDLMLPGLTGMQVLRTLRAEGHTLPVVVLTARTAEPDRVSAFRLGADDYVTKPFSLLELLERVNARLRRHVTMARVACDIAINVACRSVTSRGRPIHLTGLEFDLLCALVRAGGAVVSREDLLVNVWKSPPDLHTRTVESHIVTLRKKLRSAGLLDAIRTVHGRGVAWAMPAHMD